jgi:hypothetical protein
LNLNIFTISFPVPYKYDPLFLKKIMVNPPVWIHLKWMLVNGVSDEFIEGLSIRKSKEQ